MHDEKQDSFQDQYTSDPLIMRKTDKTKSYRHLLLFAGPYALLYVFLPSLISPLNLALSGLWWSAIIVILLNIVVIISFKKYHFRKLERIECHRIGLLTALLTLVVTSVLMVLSLYDLSTTELSLTQIKKDGVIAMLVISGAIGLVINYLVITYGLWLLQKLWPKQ